MSSRISITASRSLVRGAMRFVVAVAVLLLLALWRSRQVEVSVVELLVSSPNGARESILVFVIIFCAPSWFVDGAAGQPGPSLGALYRKAGCYALTMALLLIAIRVLTYFTIFQPLPVVFIDYFETLPTMTFWLVPLGQLLAYGALALWIAISGRLVRGVDKVRLSTFLFSFLAALDVFVVVAITWINPVAILLLSLGIAQFILRWRRWPRRPSWVPQRGLSMLVGVTISVAVGAVALERWREYSHLVEVGDAADRPNILFITLDTVRKQNLSMYGYARATSPHLDRFAARGTLFTSAYNSSSWTLPSHASMFTGLPYKIHQADFFRPLSTEFRTVAEVLTKAGYATAGFVGNCGYCGARTGLARGFAHYDDLPLRPLVLTKTCVLLNAGADLWFGCRMPDHPRQTAEEINNVFRDWLLRHRPPQRPFFAFLNYFDAHFPYNLPDSNFDKAYSTLQDPVARRKYLQTWYGSNHEWTPQDAVEVKFGIDTYDECIAYIDWQLGKLFADLEAWGVLKDTLVIITNDHGEHFGEHDFWNHGNTVYRQLIDAPLIVVWPGHVPEGIRIEDPVSLTDLASTILEMAGVEPDTPMPGKSWAVSRSSEPVVSELNRKGLEPNPPLLISLMANGLHYIRDENNREELYDSLNDPLDTQNLVGTVKGNALLPAMRTLFEAYRERIVATDQDFKLSSPLKYSPY